ncbi:C40 family peptidase [Alkaliphilus crotonatoxidans]
MQSQLENKIKKMLEQFKDVPFVHNGRSIHTGLDCLGFMVLFYQEFGIYIPDGDGSPIEEEWYYEDPERYIRGIKALGGHEIPMESLQALDLVYFSVRKNIITHTGIMINEREFAHMSSMRGFSVDSLNRHWRKFRGAIRLI